MPEKIKTIQLPGYEKEKILAICLDAMRDLNWTVKYGADNLIIGYTIKKWNRWDNQITLTAENESLTVSSKMIHGELADLPGRTTKDVDQFIAAFENAQRNFSPANLQQRINEFKHLEESTLHEATAEAERIEKTDKVMNLSKGNMNLTYLLMGFNVLVFVAMAFSGVNVMSPMVIDLVNWGANYRGLTLDGEEWRLFTCMFLHIGIIHLLLNMYALYIIGSYLERMLGKLRFLVAYICTGLIASLASLYMNDVVSAGASGAIFGMYGVFLAFLTTNLIDKKTRNALLSSIGIFVVYNLIYGFKPDSGVDNAAHLGGFISGFIAGYIFLPSIKKTGRTKIKNFRNDLLRASNSAGSLLWFAEYFDLIFFSYVFSVALS